MNAPQQPVPASHHDREWFQVWFDSPYYPVLYEDRDEREARQFIDRLLAELRPAAGARMLDLACGRGRYARYLAEKGFDVTGLDLSLRCVEYALPFEQANLSFFRHDMRMPFRTNYFDFIFNFFTSFGYFYTEREDHRTLLNIAAGLRDHGVFVLDYFNSRYVVEHLRENETKVISDIRFDLTRSIEGDHVIKDIAIDDRGQHAAFRERVRLFTLEDFTRRFDAAGLRIVQTYGDYQLSAFSVEFSPRLILVARHHE